MSNKRQAAIEIKRELKDAGFKVKSVRWGTGTASYWLRVTLANGSFPHAPLTEKQSEYRQRRRNVMQIIICDTMDAHGVSYDGFNCTDEDGICGC